MSWSITKRVGSKDKVAEAVSVELDKAAANYAGREEEKDIVAVRDRMLAAIADIECPDGIGVEVAANGSHGQWGTSITFNVTRVALTL